MVSESSIHSKGDECDNKYSSARKNHVSPSLQHSKKQLKGTSSRFSEADLNKAKMISSMLMQANRES